MVTRAFQWRAFGAFAGVFLTVATARGDDLHARTQSTLQPTHVVWRVGVGARTPGLVGVEGAVDLVLPMAPVYLGARGQWSWGYTSQQLSGAQWQGAAVGEARAGIVLTEGWSLRDVSIDVETRHEGAVTLASDRYSDPNAAYRYSRVSFPTPVFYRWTLFTGASRRWQTVDGTDARRDFGMVGVSWFRRHAAVAMVDGFGHFETDRSETWTLAATYCLGGGDPSRAVPARMGAVLEYAYQASVLAFTASAGFDGELALVNVGVGLGGAHSLGGPAPQAGDLR